MHLLSTQVRVEEGVTMARKLNVTHTLAWSTADSVPDTPCTSRWLYKTIIILKMELKRCATKENWFKFWMVRSLNFSKFATFDRRCLMAGVRGGPLCRAVGTGLPSPRNRVRHPDACGTTGRRRAPLRRASCLDIHFFITDYHNNYYYYYNWWSYVISFTWTFSVKE